jgi:hypothetical protein
MSTDIQHGDERRDDQAKDGTEAIMMARWNLSAVSMVEGFPRFYLRLCPKRRCRTIYCAILISATLCLLPYCAASAKDCTIENDSRTNEILNILRRDISDCQKIPLVVSQNQALRRLAQDPACYPNGDFASGSKKLVARYDRTISQQYAWAKKLHCN